VCVCSVLYSGRPVPALLLAEALSVPNAGSQRAHCTHSITLSVAAVRGSVSGGLSVASEKSVSVNWTCWMRGCMYRVD